MKMHFNWRMAVLFLLALAFSAIAQNDFPNGAPVPAQFKVKYYGAFSELPVGSVQPRGWIQQWLDRQAQGLTGHPENLTYPYDTCMYAGQIPPPPHPNQWWQPWWPYEQSAYFVDATTRLSWLINDPGITARRDANLNYILAHSSGTNYGGSDSCWPNAVVGRALMAQFSATGDPRYAAVMQNWLLTSADKISSGGRAGVNFEEAFYLYGLTGDPRLLNLCRRIYNGYLDDTNSFFTATNIERKKLFHEHGVTAAEELKCLPLMYSYTGDHNALVLAQLAYRKVLDHHLLPDGGIVSSEHLEPVAFDSVHESCDITDWSWSLGYLFMADGEGHLADVIERTTFNALPGAVTKDFKQLQYFSAVNQTDLEATNGFNPHWPTRMTYRAAHDTECCAGNINRAMPNYVIRMWMRAKDGGLAAVYYGPSEVTTPVNGQPVTVTEETDYPFRDEISFRIKTAKPVTFDLQCRIPEWCHAAGISVNSEPLPGAQKPGTFAAIHRQFNDGDTIKLKLPMTVHVENWLNNRSVCLTRGPLAFSLKIDEKRVEHTSDPAAVQQFLDGREIRAFPEVEFYPESDWHFGFDPSLKQDLSKIQVVESPMTDNPFIEAQAPVHLEVPLDTLPAWTVSAAVTKLPGTNVLATPGPKQTMTLVPYGATHLRLTTLPLIVGSAAK